MDQLNSGIAVHSTDKHQQAGVSDASTLPVFNEPVPNFVHNSAPGICNVETPMEFTTCGSPGLRELAPLSALGHTNIQNQITMDPSRTELAPLSALGHSNTKMQVSGSARTSPFICLGAHQYPNSNMSNVLTQYLTLVGTLLHNTFSDSTARSRMGSEKQKGGGGGATSSGANTASVPQLWYFCKGGQGQKKICDFFLRNPFLQRAQSQKLIFFCVFFLRQNNTLDRELIISANS